MIHVKSREKHDQIVKAIKIGHQASLKPTGPSNTLRNGSYKKATIDISSLNEILTLDPEEPSITVEPRITFQELCRFTLKYGLIPPVVPEFATITVGGAIMGAALESSSHRFGQVSDTCLEYEVILGNGEIVKVSPEENPDLFYGLSGSYGTLGILTSVKMRLIKAEKWVDLRHRSLSTEKIVEALTAAHTCDFVEGIVLNPSQSVMITGEMCPTPPKNIFRQHRPWSKWYIQHVADSPNGEFGMHIEEYLFRLDRGAFWMGRFLTWKAMWQLLFHIGIPKIRPHRETFLFRLFFGWALSSQGLYKMWHKVPNPIAEKLFFVHDFYTPFSKAGEVLPFFLEKAEIFPVWLCPIRATQTPQFLSPHYNREDCLNIGLYGIPKGSIPELSAQLEREIVNYGGRKMLYSFTYYDKELFSKIYDEPRYLELRKRFYADKSFPTLYEKVSRATF